MLHHRRHHPLAYCDVGQPAASCATNDVHCDSRGVDYRGTAAVTASGKACQAWAAQWPHAHTRTAENYEWSGLSGEGNNYCRNPDGEAGPWCHTTDGDTRWELCTVGAAGACDLTPGASVCTSCTNRFSDGLETGLETGAPLPGRRGLPDGLGLRHR